MSRQTPHRLTTLLAATILSIATMLLGAGCGARATDGPRNPGAVVVTATPSDPSEGSSDPDAVTVRITLAGDTITPTGTRVRVAPGAPVRLLIDSDRADDLHVHSTPEHQVEFPAGLSEAILSFDRPGIIDVEHHDLDALVVQLEVG